MGTIVEHIRCLVVPGAEAAFAAACRAAGRHLAESPECVDWELARSEEDPTEYLLRIRWVSAEALALGFLDGPHVGPFRLALLPYAPDLDTAARRLVTLTGVGGASLVPHAPTG
ncbi:putative quinol monooxygenase [Streptomyces sp. BI20]|uniref:putative quinol monooxygenase n=1 Tax=Streptomyces sp. BI20 TaxID=3403460 RepID=UPI003C72BA34